MKTVEDLVTTIYGPYIERYRHEFTDNDLTASELGLRKINEFLANNNVVNQFNEKQRIILVASDFDEQTLSAVAWLNSNNVDISCYKLIPFLLKEDVFLHVEKVLPLNVSTDYYVNLMSKRSLALMKKSKSHITRRSLPKIDDMLEWGVVKAGDTIVAKGRIDEATLLMERKEGE
ncbi:hypothetical protein [Alteribacter keqinensis]|uniref:Uncharacterized protein n=1 Tax=Alteribacter keqinensis TaxID=2483800 RepID=A0A3M7TYP9_9BACI|nr:hypothetical protein [Alteribacter keqinensis]RNA70022.1 hypothetical protein EBO34_08850 [Alteribacter keqinensis]